MTLMIAATQLEKTKAFTSLYPLIIENKKLLIAMHNCAIDKITMTDVYSVLSNSKIDISLEKEKQIIKKTKELDRVIKKPEFRMVFILSGFVF